MNCEQLLQQTNQWLMDEHVESNLMNLMALWYDQMDAINWIGIYWLKQDELLVGPFQGKPACSPLTLDHGVCAAAITQKRPQIVADVHSFKGHIACDSASNSEMVTLLKCNDTLLGVLDIDSPIKNRFDPTMVQLVFELTEMVNDYLSKMNYHPSIR